MKIIPASKARKQFFQLLKLAATPGQAVTITTDGGNPVVIMSQEEFEGWQETLEIMSDPVLTKNIREGLADAKAGRVVEWNQVKKKSSKK